TLPASLPVSVRRRRVRTDCVSALFGRLRTPYSGSSETPGAAFYAFDVAVRTLDAVDQLVRVGAVALRRLERVVDLAPDFLAATLDRFADLVEAGRVESVIGRPQHRLDDEEVAEEEHPSRNHKPDNARSQATEEGAQKEHGGGRTLSCAPWRRTPRS